MIRSFLALHAPWPCCSIPRCQVLSRYRLQGLSHYVTEIAALQLVFETEQDVLASFLDSTCDGARFYQENERGEKPPTPTPPPPAAPVCKVLGSQPDRC